MLSSLAQRHSKKAPKHRHGGDADLPAQVLSSMLGRFAQPRVPFGTAVPFGSWTASQARRNMRNTPMPCAIMCHVFGASFQLRPRPGAFASRPGLLRELEFPKAPEGCTLPGAAVHVMWPDGGTGGVIFQPCLFPTLPSVRRLLVAPRTCAGGARRRELHGQTPTQDHTGCSVQTSTRPAMEVHYHAQDKGWSSCMERNVDAARVWWEREGSEN